MFTDKNPARSVDEVVDFLRKTRRPGHLFRGQTRPFAHNAPSAARAVMRLNDATDRWVKLDDYTLKASPREIARYDLRAVMMQLWGPGVGNLLAQQYGVASDGYDFTADCDIAAFFATRSYPTYDKFSRSGSKDIGVIYRIEVEDQSTIDIEMVNGTLGSYGFLDKAVDGWIYFVQPVFASALVRYAARNAIALDIDKLYSVVPEPRISKTLLKAEVVLRSDALARLQVEVLRSRSLDAEVKDLSFTRASRQQGGMYFPSYLRPAQIPEKVDLQRIDAKRFQASPSVALIETASAVQEMRSFRGIEAFYFRHDASSCAGDLDPAYLWPDRKTDWLFDYVCRFAESSSARYLSTLGVAVEDFENGLIDPGYKAK